MSSTRTSIGAITLALLALGLVPDARALSDEEIFRNVPVHLLNPGARALSLGVARGRFDGRPGEPRGAGDSPTPGALPRGAR